MNRFVVANWKMKLDLPSALYLAEDAASLAKEHEKITIIIAPSPIHLIPVKEELLFTPPNFFIASQVVSPFDPGAYTGDISAEQLKNIAAYCLVGHSERRQYHGEKGAVISEQVKQLLDCGITPIVCFGEMRQAQHKNFSPQITLDLSQDLAGLSGHQVKQCLFAYEPVWAIGTGHPASPDYVQKAVEWVKVWSKQTWRHEFSVLYGGSITEKNAKELGQITPLDGLLVGGASQQSKSFDKVCSLYDTSV